jgi:hypothetical protein
MRHGVLDRLDAREVSLVHQVLTAGAAACRLTEHHLQSVDHRIQRRDRRQTHRRTTRLQPLADRALDPREQHQPGPFADFGQNAVEMTVGTDHRPEMFERFNPIELRECRLGHRLERFARRVRDKVKVEPGQGWGRPCGQGYGHPAYPTIGSPASHASIASGTLVASFAWRVMTLL